MGTLSATDCDGPCGLGYSASIRQLALFLPGGTCQFGEADCEVYQAEERDEPLRYVAGRRKPPGAPRRGYSNRPLGLRRTHKDQGWKEARTPPWTDHRMDSCAGAPGHQPARET